MPRFRCCNHGKGPKFFEFRDDTGEGLCPQCGAKAGPSSHSVFPLIDIHFVVRNPKGPIEGSDCRIHVACEPKRDGLAKHQWDEYAATDDPREVTCPSCRGTPAWQEMAKGFASFDKNWAMIYRQMQATGA